MPTSVRKIDTNRWDGIGKGLMYVLHRFGNLWYATHRNIFVFDVMTSKKCFKYNHPKPLWLICVDDLF